MQLGRIFEKFWSKTLLLSLALALNSCGRAPIYAHGCGPLPSHWRTPKQGMSIFGIANVLSVANDQTLKWNGVPITDTTLVTYLKEVKTLFPIPATQVTFANDVDCARVAGIRQMMSRELDCGNATCFEGSGRIWIIGDVLVNGKAPAPFDPARLHEPENGM